MTLKIDLSEEDGKPHWLSREGNPRPTKDQIRKKHRDMAHGFRCGPRPRAPHLCDEVMTEA